VICLTLSGPTLSNNLNQVKENRSFVDILELRLDLLSPEEQKKASEFPSLVDLPVILTCRRVADGGKCSLTERSRRSLIIQTLEKGSFAYVDIEDDVKKNDVELAAREKGVKIIRSYHDFEKVPEDIFSRIQSLSRRGDIAKIAVTPHSISDVITLFRINSELSDTPKIVIGMGDWGVCTRILYRKMGSILTFGSSVSTKAIAPGMISVRDLKELYRADRVDERTGIYGVVGNPVMHSLSPRIHNPGFHAINYNAVYVPFLADSIRSFLLLAEFLKLRGFSVTVPFKVDILKYLGNITREVKQIGSCNTVIRVPDMWKGTNTDYYGFLSPIEADIASGRIRNALVIGAGGAADAIVWALTNRGVKVVIVNRTLDNARRLAAKNNAQADSLENAQKYSGWADLVVQSTKVGLSSPKDNPVPDFVFTGKEVAYDIIYEPRMTAFLRSAEKAGCTLHYGLEMLLSQGKLQFESFTGYHYPKNVDPFS
jgi:3-dehydroquinate dehydratase / shikimate dehydrogenase